MLFDADWRFLKDSSIDASEAAFDDSSWRMLDLPHDWSIEDLPNQSDSVVGPFSKKSTGATATGYTAGGIFSIGTDSDFDKIVKPIEVIRN